MVSTPFGYTPGTDLYIVREYQADKYVKVARKYAKTIRSGKIITDAGYERFRSLWQRLEEAVATEEAEVWSVLKLKKVTIAQVLGSYMSKVEDDKDLILRNYMSKQ
jgi:isocitrate/isopropylmalate dehydrogenase